MSSVALIVAVIIGFAAFCRITNMFVSKFSREDDLFEGIIYASICVGLLWFSEAKRPEVLHDVIEAETVQVRTSDDLVFKPKPIDQDAGF